jgi:hypothetical protein
MSPSKVPAHIKRDKAGTAIHSSQMALRRADSLSADARRMMERAVDEDGKIKSQELYDLAKRARQTAVDYRKYAAEIKDDSPYAIDTGTYSFFGDMVAAKHGDAAAMGRLRHFHNTADQREQFAVSSSTLGGIVPGQLPPFVRDAVAMGLRASAPLVAALEVLPLPETSMNVSWGQVSTPATVGVQSAQNATVPDSPDVVVGLKQDAIVTFTATAEFSAQSQERSGGWLDYVIGYELGHALGTQLETDVWNGSGASGHLKGILQATGPSTEAVAGQTLANHATAIAGQFNAIANNLGVLPDLVALAPRRYAYLQSLTAALGLPVENVFPEAVRDNIIVSPAAPTNLSGTQDALFLMNRASTPLVRGAAPTLEFHMEGPSIGPSTLTWRYLIYEHLTLGVSRRPEGIGIVTGLTAPSL